MEPKRIGEHLVSLSTEQRFIDAIAEYYSEDIVNVETNPVTGRSEETRGIDEIRAKCVRWLEDHEIHSVSAEGPLVGRDSFSILYDFDFTETHGQAAGQRRRVRQLALYKTRHGKIVREERFS